MNDLPINTLAGRGIGDNRPPLAEVLAEELAADRARADELLAAARKARIENAADAGKVADLIALVRDQERSLDRAREARKRPLLTQQRIIEAAYGTVIGPLARARTDTLAPMLTGWQLEHADTPLATSVAAVGTRREIEFLIEDLPAVVGWLLQNKPGDIAQCARTILGNVVRSCGVDAAERGEVNIPGVSVSVVSKVQVR